MEREPRGRPGERLLTPRLAGGILLLAGFGLLALTGVIAHRQQRLFATTLRTTGTVVAVLPRHGSRESISYAPLVRYRTPNGLELDFTSGSAASRARYHVGQTVPVVYPPLNPSQAEIDGWLMRWGETAIVGGFAMILLMVGGLVFAKNPR